MEMNNKNSSTYRKYLEIKKKISKLSLMGSLMILASIAVLLLNSMQFKKYWLPFFVASLIVCFIFLYHISRDLYKELKKAKIKNYYTWCRGAGAEMIVGKSLEELLNKGYKIIDDIQNPKGNIDLVCVCSEGIFVIEVKAHQGLISWNNCLLRNGEPTEKNFVKQLHAEVYWVRDYLKKNLSKKYFINGILEFPNAQIDNKTIRGEIENVWIGGRGFSKWVIKNKGRQGYLSPTEVEKIYQSLQYDKN
jgi:hypothetical protein